MFGLILSAIADRLHGKDDAAAIAAGFVFTDLPGGRRVARLRGMRHIAADHRARVATDPDPIDRAFLTPDLIRHINHEKAAATKAARTASRAGHR